MSGPSLTPGQFREGPERDAARKAKHDFHEWLRTSLAIEAVAYRNATSEMMEARRRRSKARTRARAAFKKVLAAGVTA